MKVLEFEAKALLSGEGIAVPRGETVTSADAAATTARAIDDPVALKVQIPMGRRMKAGGIRFAGTPEEAAASARELLGSIIHGFTVDRLLVEKKLEVDAEVFVAVTYDSGARTAIILASLAGGIEVETTTTMVRRTVSLVSSAPDYLGREIAAELGFQGSQLVHLGQLITRMTHCFGRWDALLLELNPLVLDLGGQWSVADVHLELEDDAVYRQGDLWSLLPVSAQWTGQRSDFERQAADIDSADHRGVAGRLIPFQGSLGLLIGGGGASLTIMDALLDAGLEPANYCEIGGNPSVWKIKELTKLILRQPRVEQLAVIMNVVSNTRVDLVARGVIKGVLELGRQPQDVITAFRIPGSWEEEGQKVMRRYEVPFFGRKTSIDQVVEIIKCRS